MNSIDASAKGWSAGSGQRCAQQSSRYGQQIERVHRVWSTLHVEQALHTLDQRQAGPLKRQWNAPASGGADQIALNVELEAVAGAGVGVAVSVEARDAALQRGAASFWLARNCCNCSAAVPTSLIWPAYASSARRLSSAHWVLAW